MDYSIELPVSRDRHTAHRELSGALLKPGQERNFLWRLYNQPDGTTSARVRKYTDEQPLFDYFTGVSFEVETIPQRVCGKKENRKRRRLYLTDNGSRMDFIGGLLLKNGLMVQRVNVRESNTLIVRGDERFIKPAAVFTGLGHVIDPEKFRHALERGIGDGKAYGFGMLFVHIS